MRKRVNGGHFGGHLGFGGHVNFISRFLYLHCIPYPWKHGSRHWNWVSNLLTFHVTAYLPILDNGRPSGHLGFWKSIISAYELSPCIRPHLCVKFGKDRTDGIQIMSQYVSKSPIFGLAMAILDLAAILCFFENRQNRHISLFLVSGCMFLWSFVKMRQADSELWT